MPDADVISKSRLALELHSSRGRISQLVKSGLPVRPDGMLNRAQAIAWIKNHVSPLRGGWALRRKSGADIPVLPEDEAEWLDREWNRISRED